MPRWCVVIQAAFKSQAPWPLAGIEKSVSNSSVTTSVKPTGQAAAARITASRLSSFSLRMRSPHCRDNHHLQVRPRLEQLACLRRHWCLFWLPDAVR